MDAAGVSPSDVETCSAGMYFLGSLVLVKNEYERKASIVDGQQRLITLTILLCVIRDLTEDEDLKKDRDESIKQAAKPDKNLHEQLRIRLRRQKDQSFFENYIQRINSTTDLPAVEQYEGSQALIIENADYFREQLNTLNQNELTQLIKFILNSCYLVVIEVPDESAARRIFKVLNARGLDLNPTDLLKVNLLARADQQGGESLEHELSEDWEEAESALGRDRFIDLFTHIRFIFQREKPRTALEEGFLESVPPFTKNHPKKFFVDVFEPYEKALSLLDNDQKMVELLGTISAAKVEALKRLDNKDWEAPFIFCLNKYLEDGQFNIKEFITKFERLAYYLFVTRADINARLLRYGSVLDQIDLSNRKNTRNAGIDLSGEETLKFFDALDDRVYLTRRVVKPLLLRLDQALSDKSALFHQPIVTVEHVAPQTVEEKTQWAKWFSDETYDHEYWLHRIANLVLLSRKKNSAAKNYEFERKKSEYFDRNKSCPFVLTTQIRTVKNWTPTYLQKRQNKLLESLATDWDLKDEFFEWLRLRSE